MMNFLLFYVSGIIFDIFIAWLTFDSLDSGNWRLFAFIVSIVPLVGFFFTWLFLSESAEFLLLVTHEYSKALRILKKLVEANKRKNNTKAIDLT